MLAVRTRAELGLFNPVSAVIDAGSFVVGHVLDLPGHIIDQIQSLAGGLFDRFADLVGLFGSALKAAFKEVFEGIRVIAEFHFSLIVEACAFFRRFKDQVNVGILAAQGRFAEAGQNLAIQGAKAVGVDVGLPQSQSEITKSAEFVCEAIDTLEAIAVLAQGHSAAAPAEGESFQSFLLRTRARSQRIVDREVPRLSEPDVPIGIAPAPSKAPVAIAFGAAALLLTTLSS